MLHPLEGILQPYAPLLQLLEVDIGEAGLLQRYGAVMVVEVAAGAAAVGRIGERERHHVGNARRTDACDGEHRREDRRTRLHILLAVGVERRHNSRILRTVGRRGPDKERHMYAVRRRRGRSVQEALAIVVEDILAVVGRVEHCRLRPTLAQHRDDAVQYEVGLTDGVVVGVEELRTVLGSSLRRACRAGTWRDSADSGRGS